MRMRLIASIAQLLLLVGGLVMYLGAVSDQAPQTPAVTWNWEDANQAEELDYSRQRLEQALDEELRGNETP